MADPITGLTPNSDALVGVINVRQSELLENYPEYKTIETWTFLTEAYQDKITSIMSSVKGLFTDTNNIASAFNPQKIRAFSLLNSVNAEIASLNSSDPSAAQILADTAQALFDDINNVTDSIQLSLTTDFNNIEDKFDEHLVASSAIHKDIINDQIKAQALIGDVELAQTFQNLTINTSNSFVGKLKNEVSIVDINDSSGNLATQYVDLNSWLYSNHGTSTETAVDEIQTTVNTAVSNIQGYYTQTDITDVDYFLDQIEALL